MNRQDLNVLEALYHCAGMHTHEIVSETGLSSLEVRFSVTYLKSKGFAKRGFGGVRKTHKGVVAQRLARANRGS